MSSEKPVMYLDVDDTLLTFHRDFAPMLKEGMVVAAPGAGEFVRWALDNYEVRWLTAWAFSGKMYEPGAKRLGAALGIEWETLAAIPGYPWSGDNKCEGIRWDEWEAGRPFVWIEDDLLERELHDLDARGALACYYRCNVTENPAALRELHALLAAHPKEAAR